MSKSNALKEDKLHFIAPNVTVILSSAKPENVPALMNMLNVNTSKKLLPYIIGLIGNSFKIPTYNGYPK